MKKTSRAWKIFVLIAWFFFELPPGFDSISICSAQPADQNNAALQQVQKMLQRARDEDVGSYSPVNFSNAEELYQETLAAIKDQQSAGFVQQSLFRIDAFLQAGLKTAHINRIAFEELVALREEAQHMQKVAGESTEFSDAMENFRQVMLQAEAGDLKAARGLASRAAGLYREALLSGAKNFLIRDAKARIEEDRESLSPQEYETEQQNLNKMEAFIEEASAQGLPAKNIVAALQGKKWQFVSHFLPDLTIKLYDVPYSPVKGINPLPPLTDRPTALSVLVKNEGLESIEKSFNINFYIDGGLTKSWTFFPINLEEDSQHNKNPLLPGGSRIYNYQTTFAPGPHTLRWMVDSNNEIAESDESRTSNVLDTTVVCQPPSDLVVDDIWPVGNPGGGQKSIWNISIKNIGAGPATGSFSTTFWPGAAGGMQGEFWTQALGAGQSITFTSVQSFKTFKSQTMKATVDASHFIVEANESNNDFIKQVNLAPPDLLVENLLVSPSQPTSSSLTNISFTVRNIGMGDAPHPFKVKVFPGIVTAQGITQSVLLTVNGLASGQVVNLQHSVKLNPGKQKVIIDADFPSPDPVYFEPDRNNNIKTAEINVQGYTAALSIYLGESIYVDPKNPSHVARDRDGDFLKDDLENLIANSFRPYYKFDSDEGSRRAFEPITLYQVRPHGCTGAGCSGRTEVWIRWGFLFMRDGGYGPDSWEHANDHLGDNDKALYRLSSEDGGATWRLFEIILGGLGGNPLAWPGGYIVPHTTVSRPVYPWTPTKLEIFQRHHPTIYMSAHKHHLYFNTNWDHHDSYYSKWYLNDDVNGKGAAFLADLHSVFGDQRFNNVGEPEKNTPDTYFVHCMQQFPQLSWTSPAIAGNAECKIKYFSAWGTSHFYRVGGNANIWLTDKECTFQIKQ